MNKGTRLSNRASCPEQVTTTPEMAEDVCAHKTHRLGLVWLLLTPYPYKFVGFQSATSMPFWIIEMEYLVLEGALTDQRSPDSDVVNNKDAMKLRFHRTLPEIQLVRFMV